MPRESNGSFEPQIIGPYQRQTNGIEEKILAFYARGQSIRGIQVVLEAIYGIDVAPTTFSAVTDKIMPLVSAWRTWPLAAVYPLAFLDGLPIKLRRENNRVETVVYIVVAIDTEGHRDVLGHWVSDGAERQLLRLEEVWGKRYLAAIRSWLTNWEYLATFFDFPAEIRNLVYTTNRIEAYNRQLQEGIKSKGSCPTPDAAKRLLYLAHMNISTRWTGAVQGWPLVLKQLAIRFDDCLPV